MSVYLIFDIEVTDPAGYEGYKKMAETAVKQYGGKYLVRGGKYETIEGGWQPNRVVILEFPSSEQAKTWLNSPEYAPAWKLRRQYARSKMIMVEGVS